MSSSLTQLIIGSTKYDVLVYSWGITQGMDHSKMPNSAPEPGLINIRLEGGNFAELTAWAASPNMTKNGKLIQYKVDTPGSPLLTINFTNAFCVKFSISRGGMAGEKYLSDGSVAFQIDLTLAAHEVSVNDVKLTHSWPGFQSGQSGSSSSSSSSSDNSNISSFKTD